MKVMVREYLPEDFEKIEKIHDAARKEELRFAKLQQAFLPFSVAAERENFFDYKICTAILYGKVVGFGAYSEDELAWLYVDSAYFRRGIGRALVEYVLAHTSRPAVSYTHLFAGLARNRRLPRIDGKVMSGGKTINLFRSRPLSCLRS